METQKTPSLPTMTLPNMPAEQRFTREYLQNQLNADAFCVHLAHDPPKYHLARMCFYYASTIEQMEQNLEEAINDADALGIEQTIQEMIAPRSTQTTTNLTLAIQRAERQRRMTSSLWRLLPFYKEPEDRA